MNQNQLQQQATTITTITTTPTHGQSISSSNISQPIPPPTALRNITNQRGQLFG